MIRTHSLAILAFVLVSFIVQGTSHFLVNSDHFTSIGFLRTEPIMPMWLAVMVLQGVILSVSLAYLRPSGATIRDGLRVSISFGLFLAAYIALVEPSKYQVPSIPAWIGVEATASTVQFLVYGILLGLIHSKRTNG